jgi:hypothetical protein
MKAAGLFCGTENEAFVEPPWIDPPEGGKTSAAVEDVLLNSSGPVAVFMSGSTKAVCPTDVVAFVRFVVMGVAVACTVPAPALDDAVNPSWFA